MRYRKIRLMLTQSRYLKRGRLFTDNGQLNIENTELEKYDPVVRDTVLCQQYNTNKRKYTLDPQI